ncbi:MAG: excinuclease ABC subunit UvrA, partial [Magnetococcales bacterium]|nr:excinuclease ABC subunit UvrA [Magnetococcales bacterium]
DKQVKHTIDVLIDRLVVKPGIESRLADSLETALGLVQTLRIKNNPGGVAKVQVLGPNSREMLFSERHACPECGISYPEIEPRLFSFNNPFGACPSCDGLGTKEYFCPELVVPNPSMTIRQGCIVPWSKPTASMAREAIYSVAEHYEIDIRVSWEDLPQEARDIIMNGSGREKIKFNYARRRRFRTIKPWEGVLKILERRYLETESDAMREELAKFRNTSPCPGCSGDRLRKEALFIRINSTNIAQLSALPLTQTQEFFQNMTLTVKEQEISARIVKEVTERLGFLLAVGLDYLTLDRTATTLSGGEGQRIRLSNQIGSGLTGVLYILDEPSIGLHQRDNQRLLDTLVRLRDLGNTVVVVEHDEEAMQIADFLVDMGPGAGEHGGEVVSCGTPKEVCADPKSLTGRYLSGENNISVPKQRRQIDPDRCIILEKVSTNNLVDVTATLPLGLMTCITGVSGSGKSSLILDTLYPALAQRLHNTQVTAGQYERIKGLEYLDKVVHIDQSPIGRTPRSNPATYTGLFTPIREMLSQVPESRSRGYKSGRFSFNVKGGRCEACAGDGLIKIEMHFLPDVFVQCDVCHGSRYNRETLEINYKGKSIADILAMTVEEALLFFQPIPAIRSKLATLMDVGLGYIRLGQSATTLSGGEAQRVKISRELSKRATGKTLYILDEPTTGLHFDDIRKLLEVLSRLVATGNSVVVIEHNLDVIKTADWIVDLGPEGGSKGGEILVQGTPEECAATPNSWTGQYLAPLLKMDVKTHKKTG